MTTRPIDRHPTDPDPDDRELKAKHRALWAAGDYPAVAAELIPALGPALVAACGVTSGHRVLDVGAGAGNAAIPAARWGARVTASDLTPALLEVGRARAVAEGLDLEWVPGDAEALPHPDDSYDVVMSCVGAMFAPHHRAVADELVRVARPRGTLGMINWTPEGFIGRLFATMGPYAPPPPPGAQPPPLWGTEDHVRELLGDRVRSLSFERRTTVMDHCPDPRSFREYWKSHYGPTIAVYRYNAGDPARVAALDRDFLALLESWNVGGDGPARYEAEYLLVTATVR